MNHNSLARQVEQKNYDNVADLVIQYVMAVGDKEFADLSVCTLANSFNIDRSKLSRQFKSYTHMTLEAFLLKEKMSRAAFMLKAYQNIKVKEISEKIGFCTCDYFIRKFKAYYGIGPGRYRELKNGHA